MLVMAVIMCVHCAESNVASSSKTENNMTKRIDDMVENLFVTNPAKIDDPKEHYLWFFTKLFRIKEDNNCGYDENEKTTMLETYKRYYDSIRNTLKDPKTPVSKIIALIAILYTLYSTGDYDLAKNVLNMVIKDNDTAIKDKVMKNFWHIYVEFNGMNKIEVGEHTKTIYNVLEKYSKLK